MRSIPRTTLRSTRHLRAMALLLTLVGLALPAQAERRHGRWGGPDGWIEDHAQELGLDDATLAEIKQIVAASREEAESIYADQRQARRHLRELLDQDEPDFDAVMKQAEVLGDIDVRKHKHRLATMLKIRAKLTPEQRSQLRDDMRADMRDHRRWRHHGPESCEDEGPDVEEP